MKKLLCLLLTLVMISSSVTLLSSAVSETEPKLQFGEDGKFTIVQIADIQDIIVLRPITKIFLNYIADEVKPDLVVLTGDNIGPHTCFFRWMTEKNIDNFMSIFEEKGIKVAAVFGNHDFENKNTKDEQFEIYQSYSCFVGEETEEAKALTGCGTYNVPIMSGKDDSKKVFNLWFFDSQEYNEENDLGGYGCVQKDQIEWYEKTEAALTEENGGTPIPSLAFQHIIPPEVTEVLEITSEEPAETEKGYYYEKNGQYYVLPEEYRDEDTYLNETCCPPEYTNGQADSFIENGNVLGIAVGHDHKNNFVVPYKTLDIIQTVTASLGSYGDINRGARVITLDENDLSDYETDTIFYSDYFDLSDPAIYNRFVFNNVADNHSKGERLASLFKWGYYSAVNGLKELFGKA